MAEQQTVLLIASGDCGWDELRAALGALPDVRVVGEAMNAAQARYLVAEHRPALVLAAPTLDGASALPLLGELRRELGPRGKLVVLAARFTPREQAMLAALDLAGHLLWRDLSTKSLPHCLAALLTADVVIAS
ncbi:MAG TPA: hypothetical protein VFW96_14265, partial [Thermomicrobiales bacterium]|nr:hypothetical protein [Thermomicrobiales bacterium]